MPIDNRGSFPRETVRDLLGIVRALYRAERAAPLFNGDNIDRLPAIGRDLREAL